MANDGRWKFQSTVIVSSTLNIFNVKADVNDLDSAHSPTVHPRVECLSLGYPSYDHRCRGERFVFLNNRDVEVIDNQSFLTS